ncbi:MAG: hypothetical protein JWO09_1498 [Bacteroidetes bacterium]|nr:hypothetical protein [Bacteroidota bacterium]
MRTTNYSCNIVKTALLTFIFCAASAFASAQTGAALEGPALEKAVYLNKASGLPAYNRICAQYTVSAGQPEVLSKYYDQLMSDIRNIKGVIECSIDAQSATLTVKFPAENAKENRDQNLEKIKSAMAVYDIKFLSYKEGIYKY